MLIYSLVLIHLGIPVCYHFDDVSSIGSITTLYSFTIGLELYFRVFCLNNLLTSLILFCKDQNRAGKDVKYPPQFPPLYASTDPQLLKQVMRIHSWFHRYRMVLLISYCAVLVGYLISILLFVLYSHIRCYYLQCSYF